jgi:hypothetical protein
MGALEQIHSTMDLEVLPEALFSALEDLVPDAACSLDELDIKTGVVTEMTNAKLVFPEQIRKRALELKPSHPAMPAYKAGRGGVIPVTDCIKPPGSLLPGGFFQSSWTITCPRREDEESKL